MEELGARVADSPADAAAGADVLMLSLANQDAVGRCCSATTARRRLPDAAYSST